MKLRDQALPLSTAILHSTPPREPLGFIWAIGIKAETASQQRIAA